MMLASLVLGSAHHVLPLAIIENPTVIILLAVVFFLLFGTGKLKDLAKGIKDFKKEMAKDEDDDIDVTPKKKKRRAIAAAGEDNEDDDKTEAEHEEEPAAKKTG